MDVDNLGDVFSKGLGKRATLARLSTLSFQMSLFFEGWIKQICEREPYKGLVYAVYAGGDDLFLISPWYFMPKLASTISEELNKYTGEHPDIHISGGMSFIHGKYPVYQAAEDASEAEAQAKDVSGKNAFSFLNTAFKWVDFKELTAQYQKLIYLVGEEGEIEEEINKKPLRGPHSLLQTLCELASEKAKHQEEDARLKWGPWMWHGTYRLNRMEKRNEENNPAFSKGVAAIRKDLEKNYYTNIDNWATAARWAQIRLRKPKKKEDKAKEKNLA